MVRSGHALKSSSGHSSSQVQYHERISVGDQFITGEQVTNRAATVASRQDDKVCELIIIVFLRIENFYL